ncbi:ferredoxin-NADP reductase [Nocardioides albertanoniae]|uniref:Ferredoxin-NADP reductase n=1 Tax=Nocardioides albertanoniae TaxID=1175486 RepID=A0A543A302_9ACTN|nr:PDR/VanB family oxidoreductase [Nocardioides albertanoniae]TQL66962.1 ferredoxin-NADP reductase [Nocardioides albertanoniae]
MTGEEQDFFEVTVRQARLEADGVISLELVPDSGLLPAYEPGSHLDIELPSGVVRQYSLCSPPADLSFYRIAVLREPEGRGGSAEIHETMLVGKRLRIRGPRNHFQLEPSPRYLFIAGGIGITPMLAMVIRAEREKSPYEVVYVGRHLESMAFRDKLATGPHVKVLVSSATGRPDLDELVGSVTDDTLVYACGPDAMLKDLEAACERAGRAGQLRTERFASDGAAAAESASGGAFEVELRRSGTVLTVGADQGLLEVIEPHCDVMTSCEDGYCGTCETAVLEGTPEHHDTILNEREREAGKTMMVCVGRSKGPRLVLDL